MIYIKDASAIEKMRVSNHIVALVLEEMDKWIRPGVTTLELDHIAEEIIRDNGAKPAFKGYSVPGLPPFPGTICASVNEAIVHGIPSNKVVLKEGDIIGVDVGTFIDGYYGDGAKTYPVGGISDDAKRLMRVTRECLYKGIAQARPGNRIGDISHAIGSYIRENGYYAAEKLTGHGIGRALHEEPTIMNIGRKGFGARIQKGMVFAIEPMVNIGTHRVMDDGWNVYVADRSLSAHYEHTILVTDNEPEILTLPDMIQQQEI